MKALSVKQAYSKKFKKFEFEGIWQEVFGNPETTGGWIIHGDEKQGKSTFALKLPYKVWKSLVYLRRRGYQ